MSSSVDYDLIRILSAKTVVDQSTGCWEWKAYCDKDGYGVYSAGRKKTGTGRVHRNSWIGFHGEIPAGLMVLHRCDNTSCWNPAHLFLGTNRDNVRDMMEKGRHPAQSQTHCKYGHEFTPENTHINGHTGGRVCKTCGAWTTLTGVHPSKRNHCAHDHEYTLENTRINKNGHRHCRTCERDWRKNRDSRG